MNIFAPPLAVLALLAAPGPTDAPPASVDLQALDSRIAVVTSDCRAHLADIDARSGLGAELYLRMQGDTNRVIAAAHGTLDPRFTPADLSMLVDLDRSLVDQLSTGTFHDLGTVRGTDTILLRLSDGGKEQPVAVFVPTTYGSGKPSPLIIYLHGKGEHEGEVIASHAIRELAQGSGSIVVAPFLNGKDLLADRSVTELYRLVDLTEQAFTIDRRFVYLAGHSLGGFATFKAAAVHPDRWTALLVAAGAVAEADSDAVAQHLRGKPVYLVAGGADNQISAVYMRQLAAWLGRSGALPSYYEQPGASHDFAMLEPAFSRAWRDMLAGVRNRLPESLTLPSVPPKTPKPY